MEAPCNPSRRLWFLLSAALVVVAACDRPGPVADSSDHVSGQAALTGSLTTLQFNVTRADDSSPVQYATISVFLDPSSTTAPTLCSNGEVVEGRNCWLITDALGQANIQVPTGGGVAYLARLLPPEWVNLTTSVLPSLTPGPFTPVATDLGALTCGRNRPVDFTPGRLSQCMNNLYLTPRGTTETVNLALPYVGNRNVTVKDLQGNTVTTGVYAWLIEALQNNPPWQTLQPGTKAGFLKGYGLAPNNVPGSSGYIEVYGSNGSFEIAGTQPVSAGTGGATVETSPVICANGTENVPYTITKNATNSPFSFTQATWAFSAYRGSVAALSKDSTTTVVVLKFSETGGPHTIDISQRMRTANGTLTAGATVVCTDGICDVANAVLSTPGNSNPMTPHLYQPKSGKLIWVVENIDKTADSEWSARASSGGTNLDQIPNPSKKNASSAFQLFSKAFTFCDPDFSFDGGWGASI